MCLAIPGQIVEIVDDERDIAKVEFSGVRRNVNITLVRQDGANVGNWVLVHVGFALRVIDEKEAAETLRFLEMIGAEFRAELDQIGGADPMPDLATQSQTKANP
jgi:hydrogenase expression/formation protein HypC